MLRDWLGINGFPSLQSFVDCDSPKSCRSMAATCITIRLAFQRNQFDIWSVGGAIMKKRWHAAMAIPGICHFLGSFSRMTALMLSRKIFATQRRQSAPKYLLERISSVPVLEILGISCSEPFFNPHPSKSLVVASPRLLFCTRAFLYFNEKNFLLRRRLPRMPRRAVAGVLGVKGTFFIRFFRAQNHLYGNNLYKQKLCWAVHGERERRRRPKAESETKRKKSHRTTWKICIWNGFCVSAVDKVSSIRATCVLTCRSLQLLSFFLGRLPSPLVGPRCLFICVPKWAPEHCEYSIPCVGWQKMM